MEIKPADKEIIDRKDLRYKRKVSNKGIKDMDKQAYESIVKRLLNKRANNEDEKAIRPIMEAPITTTSSLVSSTPSSLVSDVLSSPVNIAMAGSASSGTGAGARRWIWNKNVMGKYPAVAAMLFPNTVGLWHTGLMDLSKFPVNADNALKEMSEKGLAPGNDNNYGPRLKPNNNNNTQNN